MADFSELLDAIHELREPESFPIEAIELLESAWEHAAPRLLEAVQDDLQAVVDKLSMDEAPEELLDDDSWIPEFDDLLFQAVYLFGVRGYEPAFPTLLQLLDLPLETGMLGDFLFEGLPRSLAACAGGDARRLRVVLHDPDADQSARVVAWDALLCLVAWGRMDFGELQEDLRERLADPLEAENDFLLDVLVGSAARLPVDESCLDLARRIASMERPEGGSRLGEFEAERGAFHEGAWREELLASGCQRLEDASREIEPWFSAEPQDDLDEDGYDADGNWTPPSPVVQLRSEKVGRNDPCVCGSGLKYKKCCGKES